MASRVDTSRIPQAIRTCEEDQFVEDRPQSRKSTISVSNPSTTLERLDEALRQAQSELGDTGAPINIRIGDTGRAAGPMSAVMTWDFWYDVEPPA